MDYANDPLRDTIDKRLMAGRLPEPGCVFLDLHYCG
jgi:hypothetical protein